MYNLVVEANIKNQVAGPVASAWDAALRQDAAKPKTKRVHASLPSEPKSNNGHNHASDDSCCSPGISPNTTSLTDGTAFTLKAAPRAKNFWEKDVADAEEEIAIAGAEDVLGSASGPGTPGRSPFRNLNRMDSPVGSPSPVKPHSPVRKASFTRDL